MKLRLRRSDVVLTQSDVMRSALLTREAHITCEANITPEGHITFRVSGTHRCKKHLLAQVLFSGRGSKVLLCEGNKSIPFRFGYKIDSIFA